MTGVLAIITARGGSKGLPRKNVLPLGGSPLIAWTVRAALNARCIARVVVSTDDDEIAETARAAGAEVPFRRPAELGTDAASSVDVMLHALDAAPGFEQAVLLQPTSPFRTSEDIDAGFALWQAWPGAGSCVSVCEVPLSPWLMYGLGPNGRLEPLLPEPPRGLRRQDLPKALMLTGALYFIDVARFRTEKRFVFDDSIGFEMAPERSLDIDTEADFAEAESKLAIAINTTSESTV